MPIISPCRLSSLFFAPCDFYTIDVADSIGQSSSVTSIESFVKRHPELLGSVQLELVDEVFEITPERLQQTAQKFLAAVKKAVRFTARSQRQGHGQFYR